VTDGSAGESEFSRSVSAFLPLVTSRRPQNDFEKTQIYLLRYHAYLKEGALPPDAPKIFKDAYDDAPNAATFGCYIEDRLSSSIRLHIATPGSPTLPALAVFPDLLLPMIERGLSIMDTTRFVVDATAARLFPRLPYATVRLSAIAGVHFDVDIALAAVRVEHQSFYRRLFGYKSLCEPRPYPTLAKPICLMAVDFRAARDSVLQRYPFFKSTLEERRAIFGCGGATGNPR
jgi:hypothetical protein